jgi:hypothetical protein
LNTSPRVLRRLIPALVLLLPAPLFAAGSVCAPPPPRPEKKENLDELAEVVVVAKETSSYLKDLRAWLKRLVGQYNYEGYVDICGNGNPADQRPVTGRADCIALGSTSNIQCTVNMRWPVAVQDNGEPVPGGSFNLFSAHAIYSVENRYIPEQRLNRWGLMSMQVDSRGRAEWASGALIGDSFVSKGPCVGMPGSCQKHMRITARPNAKEIYMVVDIEVGEQPVMRQALELHRESKAQRGDSSGRSSR